MALETKLSLKGCFAKVLSQGCRFTIHHLSTPPTKCPAIFAAPPGELPEDTYCESHFLSASIDPDGPQFQVFAIEVLIYTTDYLTTLFVSKADSTGYLHLLKLPEGTPSPLRILSTTFLQYLIEERRRPDRRLVLSLFARAQNQYLFPGSVENIHKHVLDDRGLIKWWCKVVDPILGIYGNDEDDRVRKTNGSITSEPGMEPHGFLRVPGCDTYETRGFIPRSGHSKGQRRWSTTDPLLELGKQPHLPERCLIPRFPDDPKARFVEQLDDELPDDVTQPSLPQTEDALSTTKQAGRWRSVQSLEQFWEMMSFRQECSSGRLVGFLWAVFQPANSDRTRIPSDHTENTHKLSQRALPTPLDSQHQESARLPPQSPLRSSPALEPLSKTPPMSPSNPSPAPTPIKAKEAAIQAQPEETKAYYWPLSSRGEVVLRQKDYQQVANLLLRLDYADEEVAADSTRKWIDDVARRVGVKNWGYTVAGEFVQPVIDDAENGANPEVLDAGVIRKRKHPADNPDGPSDEPASVNGTPAVNMLSTGLIRKKAKVANHVGSVPTAQHSNANVEPG